MWLWAKLKSFFKPKDKPVTFFTGESGLVFSDKYFYVSGGAIWDKRTRSFVDYLKE